MNLAMLYPRILCEYHVKMSRSYAVILHAFEFNYIPFVYLHFYFHHSRKWVKKILLWFMSKSILCMFFPKSFIVFSLTFRSLIHFEFIFMYGGFLFGYHVCFHVWYSNFILLHIAVQFSQNHVLKRLSFPHGIFMPSLLKVKCPDVVLRFISGISLLFHWSIFLFCASTILFWWL